ncbi:tRNA sulfurtransferase [Halostella sp. PRR32]|uniref:tRNA sulfurtransferase n=1 Tax=Halostella sp. PRR32 TaxID=3098147 RepID=UPI002B1CE965|nr:tRNA sulfurtransferase [Halostella sp. PRR32]
MKPPGADTVVVRYGDINQKSGSVQRDMAGRLVENVEALLSDRDIAAEVEHRWTRPLVHTTESQVEAATDAVSDAFGVVSASPALVVSAERAAIEDALARAAREHYDGGTFAVDARRAGDSLPFTSKDVEEFGGQAVWESVEDEFAPEVDLDDPDLTFFVECRKEGDAFVFLEKRAGPGGLPLGSQAPVVALVSGGIDSPVAAYEVMKRGAPIVPVYVDLGDYGGPDHEARAMETVRTLAERAPNFDFRVRRVPAGDTVSLLVDELEQGRMLAFRRFIYRVAERVAEREGAHGIVTGEALGQKSSQTARNFGVTSRATDLPVHRPLLSLDKNEITERARRIGTFSDSTIPAGCNRFAPDQAETNARIEPLREAEPDDLFERAERAAEASEYVDP